MAPFRAVALLGAAILARAHVPSPLLQRTDGELARSQAKEDAVSNASGTTEAREGSWLVSANAQYVKGDSNANACPHGTHPLHTEEDCKAASSALGFSYDGKENDPRWPAGCYVVSHWGWSYVYLNGHATGTAHGSGSPLCGRIASYHDNVLRGKADSVVCPRGTRPIRSITSCKSGAASLGLRYLGEENEAAWPVGCYISTGISGVKEAVYHNGHKVGDAHKNGAPMCAQPTNDDSCLWSENGVCDGHPHCEHGTDCTDCGGCGNATELDEDMNDDSCLWARDEHCDVDTGKCPEGTDCTDCGDCVLPSICDAIADCSGHGITTDVNKTDGCLCHCTHDYSGANCSIPPVPCNATLDCSGHGHTNDTDASDGCDCSCTHEYRGDDCSIPPTCNSTHHCNGHATLDEDSSDGCECHCDHGWTGDGCNIPPPCDADEHCNGHGTTEDKDHTDGCECHCEGGWSDEHCYTPPACDPDAHCSGHGRMHDLDATDGCQCSCEDHFHGDDCSIPNKCYRCEKWDGPWVLQ